MARRRKAKDISFAYGDDYMAKLEKLESASRERVIGPAVYAAAKVVTDEVRAQLRRVPTDDRYGTQDEPASGPRPSVIAALKSDLGIAKLRDDGHGFINVKIGWDGYSEVATKKYPKGQPLPMLAASVCRGTSFMRGHDFVKKGVSAAREPAVAAMGKVVDAEIEKIMKEKG